MLVRVEKGGPVTTIVLNRSEVRNAVDRATAEALADSFDAFERDEASLVDGGTGRLPRLIGLGLALDLILTGRPVSAAEAVQIGLATHMVPHGAARAAAERLAQDLARFPQAALRGDRLSAWEQFGLTLDEALANEFRRGIVAAGEAKAGAARFAAGASRHGLSRTSAPRPRLRGAE